jgi:hypothetical protein
MKTMAAIVCAMMLVCGGIRAEETKGAGSKPEARPLIQMAILLDTSGSMDGLIEQAKSQLWKIVNEFITSTREGKKPELQVALYEYGKDGMPAAEGFLRQIVPLTTDLDKVSEELFKLKTNGGEEYCGWVIKSAVEGLQWSKSNSDLKVIFIAGNEPFTQGSVNYADSCKAAIAKGIIVNTIHCGDYNGGIQQKWQDGAVLADGKYMHIDQNSTVVHIDAPQDKEIARLGVELNKTYIAFGAQGAENKQKQEMQDTNAASTMKGADVQRAVCKSSSLYSNGGWDLVDASKENVKKIEEMKDEELPEEMRKMTVEQRKAFVEGKAKERADLQKQIETLNAERIKYVAEESKKRADSKDETLDKAMAKAAREQAAKKNFEFK